MGGQVVDPERLGMVDEHPEHPVPGRRIADQRALDGADAVGDELA